jgi:hypothetical protein
MKKILIIALFLIISFNLFSDFQFGPYVVYKFPINKGELSGIDGFGIEDFWFGLDTRLKIKIFQATASMLYHPPAIDYSDIIPPQFTTLITLGVSFDLAVIRFGLGVGPGFIVNIGADGMNTADFTTQARVMLDIMMGRVALGISMNTLLNVSGEGDLFAFNNFSYNLGFSILFGGSQEKRERSDKEPESE